MPGWAAEEFFFAVREAIRNAVTHSGALRIRVGLSGEPLRVMAQVSDNGYGFDPAAVDQSGSHGHGLASMR